MKIADKIQQLATSFQKKLAQHNQTPPSSPEEQQKHLALMQYLMRALPLAAFNVGVQNVIVTRVDYPKEDGTIGVWASNIPAEKMTAVKTAFDKMMSLQKPELVGKINLQPSGY